MYDPWLLTALSGVTAAVAILILRVAPVARFFQDQPTRPNAMHTSPVPRIGGLAMLLAVALLIGFLPRIPSLLGAALLLAGALALISVADDLFHLSPWLRLAAHGAAATLMVLLWVSGIALSGLTGGGVFLRLLDPLFVAIVILAIAWMTNVFNFMDGANGLAGSMAAVGFGAYALAAGASPIATQAPALTSLCAIIAGAAIGFLFFNFPRARVFMGDAGSIPLGFLAATFGIHGTLAHIWAWWFPLLVFSPFWVDASVTLGKRIFARKKIWHAHREHYYHRLILGGWSHARTALAYFFLMLATSLSALFLQMKFATATTVFVTVLAMWVVIYGLVILILERRFATRKNIPPEPTPIR